MDVKIVTVATGIGGTFLHYANAVKTAGIEMINIGLYNFTWARRLNKYWVVAKQNPDDLLIFTDAWDVLFYHNEATLLELEEQIEGMVPGNILFGGEINVWPPDAGHYPLRGSKQPYLYLNAGMFAGLGSNIALLLEYFNMHQLNDSIDDQREWHRIANNKVGQESLVLDGTCRMFQNLFMAEDDVEMVEGRPHNKRFDTWPMFIHGNGKVPLDRFIV